MDDVRYIHQIFIQDGGSLPDAFPESISENTAHVRKLYPKAEYKLYSGEMLREFIGDNFEEKVLNAYDALQPFAYKCDLGRLCLLYVLGGLYVDLGIRIFFSLHITGKTKILLFRCPLHRENHPWDVENSLMYSVPRREEFKVAIDIICSNVEKQYYGVNTLAPTGPGVIGRAIAIVGAEEDYDIGFSSVSNTALPVNFFNYILPNGKFVATRSKDGRLNVVIPKANDYNDFWHARIVYGEPTMFLAKHFQSPATNGKSAGNSLRNGGIPFSGSGCVIWGPYKFLRTGRWKVNVLFAENSVIGDLIIDFFDLGLGVLHQVKLSDVQKVSACEFCLEFDNPYDSRLFEARLHSRGKARGELISITFYPIDRSRPTAADSPDIPQMSEQFSSAADHSPSGGVGAAILAKLGRRVRRPRGVG